MPEYKSLLQATTNTRDLGGYRCADGTLTRSGRILRSDILRKLTPEDICFLRRSGFTTVIDMREPASVARDRCTLQGEDGFIYHACPVVQGSAVPASVEEVPLSYLSIAQSPELARVFRLIADAPEGVIYQCNAGKDRTGVVSAILLLLAGVTEEEICRDYLLTYEFSREVFDWYHARFPQVDMQIVIPNRAYILQFLRLFGGQYGSAEAYLHSIGLSDAQIISLRRRLTSA